MVCYPKDQSNLPPVIASLQSLSGGQDMSALLIGGSIRGCEKIEMSDSASPVIFANIGVSPTFSTIEQERKKIDVAVSAGAHAISELSLTDNISYVQNRLLENQTVPFSTVTAYEAYIAARNRGMIISPECLIRIFEDEIKRGFDIITLHATVFRSDDELIKKSNRLIPCTSRGGKLMLDLLIRNGYENPFYVYFDDILSLAKKYSVAVSLGPCFRPASVCDAGLEDELHFLELKRMSDLIRRAKEVGVGIAVEGIGHAPISRIPQIVQRSKEICNAPYRVLTVATDIALGYDHIASAIASSIAVYHGANSITCVTRSEHIGLPSEKDIEEAVISAKIAAYCGFSARINDFSKDSQMSAARSSKGCLGDISLAIFPKGVYDAIQTNRLASQKKSCGMCGDYCPFELAGT